MKVKLAVAFAVLLFASAAHADGTWVYTYTGNPLNSSGPLPNCQCSVDGSFTTSAPISSSVVEPISVLSYSFTVAGFTFNSSDSTGTVSVSTNSSGNIAEWFISLDAGNYVNLITASSGNTQNFDSEIDVYGFGSGPYDSDYLYNDPGTWTAADPKSMPEPSSLLLSAMGLIALIALTGRRNPSNFPRDAR
jgi:hypothetical protein